MGEPLGSSRVVLAIAERVPGGIDTQESGAYHTGVCERMRAPVIELRSESWISISSPTWCWH